MLRASAGKTMLAAISSLGLVLSASRSPANEPSPDASSFAPVLCGKGEDAPGFTEAIASYKPLPKYPRDALDAWSEGWALLEYRIRPDGSVHDIAVVDALGPKEFVASSVKTIGTWRYKPATRNGVPVEQFLFQSSVLYLNYGSGRSATHGDFVRKYRTARAFLSSNQYDEAIAILETAFKARLNLYEEAMGSYLLAIAYARKGDWQRALFHIRHSTIEGGQYLEKDIRVPAYALEVELEARDWNFVDAECAFKFLHQIDPLSAAGTSEAAKTIARIHEAVQSPKPLVFEAKLTNQPFFEASATWRHQLLRAKFFFAEIKGDVKSFKLSCMGAAHEAAVDIDTQWDVPSNAGTCILRVNGSPGATFRVIEEW